MTSHARAAGPIRGVIHVPGDKSVSHRALILSALSGGACQVTGLLEAQDVLHTAACLRALGADIEKTAPGTYDIMTPAFTAPQRALYAGNAGTGVRLLMGAVAGLGLPARFEGDASLRRRPMGRVLEPLRHMGLAGNSNAHQLPLDIAPSPLHGISYRLPKPSAQVKSAILLAGLGAEGMLTIDEPQLSRDHTERMLATFGVDLDFSPLEGGGRRIRMQGGQPLKACDIKVPGDPSSAAFPVVAALVTPGSDLKVTGVMVNPHRTGLYTTLREMGGDVRIENPRLSCGEEIADIRVRYSGRLKGVEVPADRAAAMIDEYPILAIAAATAGGDTLMTGIGEMRVKESDRIAAVEEGLHAAGVDASSGPDWLQVTGRSDIPGCADHGVVRTHLDHRIAMSFLILGLIAEAPVPVDSTGMIATSFPEFVSMMTAIGARFDPPTADHSNEASPMPDHCK